MKKIIFVLLLCMSFVFTGCILTSCSSESDEEKTEPVGNAETLYVYNWGEYISDGSEDSLDVNAEFEKYCREVLHRNVKVNYSTFSSNEDMFAKVSSKAVAYDVLIPSDYMIQRMAREELLLPLDLSKIPNYENISEEFKGENIYYELNDGNLYSIPYSYGTIGVIYNTAIVDEENPNLGSWSLMWDETHSGDILQYNNSRDAFATALYYLGYSVNSENEAEWREAFELLKEQKNVVQGYVMDEIFNKMESGSAAISSYYAGDFLTMYCDNEDLAFYYPEEGINIFVDAMCVPANAPSPDLAMEYINFMCSEEIATANAEYICYASPNKAVVENEDYVAYMEEEIHEDAMTILYGYLDAGIPTEPYLDLNEEQLDLINELWEDLKIESTIGTGIYIGCGIVLAGLVALVVYLILKKRRWSKLYD